MDFEKTENIEKRIKFPAIGEDTHQLTDAEMQLIEEIKILNNSVRELALKNYYKIGTKFHKVYSKSYGNDTVTQIAQKADMSKSTLYKCLKIADLFTDEDIEFFCSGGTFVLSHKWIKAFTPFGREAIMETFKKSGSLQEFKEKMKSLKLEQKQQTSDVKSEHSVEDDSEKYPSNLPPGAKSPEQSDEQSVNNVGKDQVSDDQNDTQLQLPADSSENNDENANDGQHSDSDTSEKGADINTSFQDINSDKATGEDSTDTGSHNKETSGNNSTETVPKEDSAGAEKFDNELSVLNDNRSDNVNPNNNEGNDIATSENEESRPATPKPNSSKTSTIKQSAGASVPSSPVKSASAGVSLKDRLDSKSPNNVLDAIDLAAAGAKLKHLEAENKRLLERITALETENSKLKQEVEKLRSQQSEEEFHIDIDDFLQSSETEEEEEKDVEMA